MILLFCKQKKDKVLSINSIESAIFDLDGTLVDSKAGIVNGLKDAFLRCGFKVPENAVIPVGPPLYDTILNVFPNIDNNSIERITETFRNTYHSFDLPLSKPFDNIVNLLKTLKEYGVKTYIATYKPKVFSSKILEKYFTGLYEDVITPTELPTWTDIYKYDCTKSDIVEFLVKKHKINPSKSFVAGDSITDIEAAHKNKMISIAANYGYGDNLHFAHYSANTPLELCEIILSLVKKEQYQQEAV